MSKLIKDKDKFRNCSHNKAILGYWKSWYYFYSYRKSLREVHWPDVLDALILICTLLIWIVIFPLVPFIRCYTDWKRAVHEVSKEAQEKIDKLHK